MKKLTESFENFKKRNGLTFAESDNKNLNLAVLIYSTSMYVSENKLNGRRQIVRIKKILDENNNQFRKES